jgi:hypothetical protein
MASEVSFSAFGSPAVTPVFAVAQTLNEVLVRFGVTVKLSDALAPGISGLAVGTQMWACAMNGECVGQGTNEVTNAFTKQVTDNVIQRFDQGSVGLTSPSVNNVKNFYKEKMKYVKK